jgi:lipoteichoic acid synthase
MCVAAFTIVLNLVYNSSRQLNVVTYHAIGLWNEEQVEKSKNEYRDMLATAIVPNMVEKGRL